MPISKRPNLLLKGSGRVNRILGPEEDLSGILAKERKTSEKTKGAVMLRTRIILACIAPLVVGGFNVRRLHVRSVSAATRLISQFLQRDRQP